jgi:hypothetical protein
LTYAAFRVTVYPGGKIMKQSVLIMSVLVICVSCAGAPSSAPLQYHIEGSGDPDILIVESLSFEEKSRGFQKDAIYMQLRNNTDKPIFLSSPYFIQNGSKSSLVTVTTPNPTKRLINDTIEPNATIGRYFYPSIYSFGGDSFSIIFDFYTIEIPAENTENSPTTNYLYEGISELPEEERFAEIARRFMNGPEYSNIETETEYSIRLDFTRIEQ